MSDEDISFGIGSGDFEYLNERQRQAEAVARCLGLNQRSEVVMKTIEVLEQTGTRVQEAGLLPMMNFFASANHNDNPRSRLSRGGSKRQRKLRAAAIEAYNIKHR